jgi:predicted small lipoprotein YifL
MRPVIRFLLPALLLLFMLVSGCGQKGPLFLSEPETPAPPPPPLPEVDQDQADKEDQAEK